MALQARIWCGQAPLLLQLLLGLHWQRRAWPANQQLQPAGFLRHRWGLSRGMMYSTQLSPEALSL